MAIDVKKVIRNRNPKMSESETKDALSKYMNKVILEHIKWTQIETNKDL